MDDLMGKVVAVAVALLLVAILFPIALNVLADANTTGVDPVVIVVLTMLLPVLAILAIAIYFIKGLKG